LVAPRPPVGPARAELEAAEVTVLDNPATLEARDVVIVNSSLALEWLPGAVVRRPGVLIDARPPVVGACDVRTPQPALEPSTGRHHVRTLVGVSASLFRYPSLGGERPDLTIAGARDVAVGVVAPVLEAIGFRPVYVGDGPHACLVVEALATAVAHFSSTDRVGLRVLHEGALLPPVG
jgi:hypothetical protein